MTTRVFIDGESGTTGLQIREALAGRSDLTMLGLDVAHRKDPAAKRAVYKQAEIVILCLPDAAAREAASIISELPTPRPRILDASTAHRVAEGWTYGFPELGASQPEAIRKADRVANPGCYATGVIALVRPLVDAGLIAPRSSLTINAVSGYSGGGKSMIEAFETGAAPAFEIYALDLEHKHLPEIERYGRLERRPIFVPSVGAFRQGMLVSIPLFLDDLPGAPDARDISLALARHYDGCEYVRALDADSERIEPEALNGTNRLELRVYGAPARRQAVLVARLDNLGKGASGAAVQNLDLMKSGRV